MKLLNMQFFIQHLFWSLHLYAFEVKFLTERIAANKQNQGHNFFPFQDPYIRGEHLGTGPDTPGHHRFVDTSTLHGTHQVVLLCPTYLFTIKAR